MSFPVSFTVSIMGVRQEYAARTRAALIRAGIELFTAEGFGAVSTTRICEAAGVTRGALYHHFADKRRLMEACFATVDHALVDRLAATPAPSADGAGAALNIRAACRAFVAELDDPSVRQILFVEAPAALGWTRWRELDGGRSLALVRDRLRAGHAAGVLGAAHDPDALAHLLLGALNEAAMYVAASRDPAAAAATASRELDALLDDLLRPRSAR